MFQPIFRVTRGLFAFGLVLTLVAAGACTTTTYPYIPASKQAQVCVKLDGTVSPDPVRVSLSKGERILWVTCEGTNLQITSTDPKFPAVDCWNGHCLSGPFGSSVKPGDRISYATTVTALGEKKSADPMIQVDP